MPPERCVSRRLFGLVLAAVGVGAFGPSPSAAQDGGAVPAPDRAELGIEAELAAPDARSRVAVLLVAVRDADRALADDLSELLVGAVAARGEHVIVGKEELQAQLGQDDAATLDCVASMPCLGRLGVQLGVTEVVAGTIARRGDVWAFHLDRLDVRRAQLERRVFREVRGDLGVLADVLTGAIPELYAPAVSGASVVLECNVEGRARLDGREVGRCAPGTPLRLDAVPSGRHTVRVDVAAATEVRLDARVAPAVREAVHPIVWVAAPAAVSALAIGIGLGASSQRTLGLSLDERVNGTITRADALGFYAAREREAIAADLLFLVSALGATTAVVALFFPERIGAEPGFALAPNGVRGVF